MVNKKMIKEQLELEELDMISEDDEVIGSMTRKEAIEGNILHRGVAIVIFDGDNNIFVQKRSKNKRIGPGLWEIGCGGAVQKGETYEDAARRELKEEFGIEGTPVFVKKIRYNKAPVNFICHLCCVTHYGDIEINKEEVEEGKFVKEIDLLKIVDEKEFLLDNIKVVFENLEEIKETSKL